MEIKVDMHTHTLASSHAYSTVWENLTAAKSKNLQGIAITDHGPEMEDAPHLWHFFNMRVFPREVDGVFLLRGIECNVKTMDGRLDYPERFKANLDFAIASFHEGASPEGTFEEITECYLNVVNNPFADILGHTGNEYFKFDYEKVVKECKRTGKIIEINNGSFSLRRGSTENCAKIAKICAKYKVPVVVNSDAHICFGVGVFDNALSMLQDVGFPEELILNTSIEKVLSYFKEMGREIR